MEYMKIIENILSNSELIAQCKKTVSQIEASGAPTTELFHASRFLSLERVDFETDEGASDTLKEVFVELNSLMESHNTSIGKNAYDDSGNTVTSLQLSSVLDSILQKVSRNEQRIYLYRYFFIYSITDIASLCHCHTSNITKTLTSINTMLKYELKKANLNCNTKTLLNSFADIDTRYLTNIISNVMDDDNKEGDKKTKPRYSIPWKKILNHSLAVLFVVLIIGNLYFLTDRFMPRASKNNEKINEAQANSYLPYKDLFIYRNDKETVNINALLDCVISENYSNGAVSYESKNFVGIYSSLILDDTIPLDDCVGEEIPEMQHASNHYYKLKGVNSVQYIIGKSYDTYRLYSLTYILQRADLTETSIDTSYYEILHDFYGIESDMDIECITVSIAALSTGFDDDDVKKLINEPNDISQILYILVNCKYNGNSNNPESSVPQINTNPLSTDYLLNTSVKLAIEKKDGTIIEDIYYMPDYHYFTNGNILNSSFSIVEDSGKTLGKYLDNMLDFTQHDREPIDPANWNLDIQIDNLRHTEVDLSLTQKGTPINGLYLGQDYIIEKYEDGKWVELPTHSVYDKNTTSKLYNCLRCHNGTSGYTFSMSQKYSGWLDTGKYRLTFTVYDSFSKDLNNPISRNYTVEYEKTS
ncbi:MAG: hypothetical protein IJD58_08260 [Lachnospiraceae bacterium]|nr:hypothetical protein [Lachnospiraceae bacterium]